MADVKWQLQDAKQRFSELIRRAEADGPQIVTRHGHEVVVVLSAEEFYRLQAGPHDFKEYLLSAPDLDFLDIRRDKTPARTVDLPLTS
jgi:prevent-host-death family protein